MFLSCGDGGLKSTSLWVSFAVPAWISSWSMQQLFNLGKFDLHGSQIVEKWMMAQAWLLLQSEPENAALQAFVARR